MKSIIFLCLLIFIFSEESSSNRLLFLENIQKSIPKYTLPEDHANFVHSVSTTATVFFYTIKLEDISKVQRKFSISNEIAKQIKSAAYRSGGSDISKLYESVGMSAGTYKEVIGAAYKDSEDPNKVHFALITAITNAKNILRYKTVYARECHTTWIFFEACDDVPYQIPVEHTAEEIEHINTIMQYYSMQYIKDHIDDMFSDDFSLYMTEGNSVTSDDGRSIVYITDFGDIVVGPSGGGINIVKPIEYITEYDATLGYTTTKSLYEKVENCYAGGNSQVGNKCCKYNKGEITRYNFLMNTIIQGEFLCDSIAKMEAKRKNGPFVFKVLNNGKAVLYEYKTKKIIWSNEFATHMPGPFDIVLSNDKRFGLKSYTTNQTVYFNPPYMEFPTIYYDYNLHRSVSNGQMTLEYADNKYFLGSMMINTEDNNRYPLEITACYFQYKKIDHSSNTNSVVPTYNIPPLFQGLYGKTSHTIEIQKVTSNHYSAKNGERLGDPHLMQSLMTFQIKWRSESVASTYDICYSAYLTGEGWTKFYCNNEQVGYMNSDKGIHNIVIITKPKSVPLKDIEGCK